MRNDRRYDTSCSVLSSVRTTRASYEFRPSLFNHSRSPQNPLKRFRENLSAKRTSQFIFRKPLMLKNKIELEPLNLEIAK